MGIGCNERGTNGLRTKTKRQRAALRVEQRVVQKVHEERMWFAAMCGVERQVFVIFSNKNLERNGTYTRGADLIARACTLGDVVGKKAEATQSRPRSP